MKITGAEFVNQYNDKWTVKITVEGASTAEVTAFLAAVTAEAVQDGS